ncbi:hypothetical protein [Desulfovibrio sp.]|uniref:hypothetical protein n=1 Tax=Desulfovibrio sp. TaxID=885 RepID=UPI0023BC6F9E|nr:hypothetical protein [Desulfovibrio sp.]MDE7240994.1 hypothetical protein [Desulfovibrio sp.]
MAGVYGNMMIPLKPRGGALPEYQGSGAPYVPGSGMGGRLSGEGARVAAAAVKVAAQADADRGAAVAGLAKAADHAVQVGLKAYGDYESAVAQNAFNHYQQEEMRLRAELNTLEGKNALGEEGVEARLARWRADARERLGAKLGDIGHRMFSRAADKLDAQSDAWAVGKVNKENIAFQNTVSEGSILNARNLALENPGDEAALANAVGIIKAEYERMGARSGWDEGFRDAKFAEVRGKLAFDRASALIAAGDLDAAERAIGGGTASAPGSLSERNLAAYNFGNVKNTKGNFVAYASRQDGLMGLGERPLRYANAPEKGWHAESLLDMVKIYAPKGDGANDPEKYAAFLGSKLGIDPKAKIDFRDPKILAGLIKWMPVMEHGAQRVNISVDEAMQAAKALLAGEKPNIVGEAAKKGEGTVQASGASTLLSPAQRAQLQKQLDTMQKKQAVDGFLSSTTNMPVSERLTAWETMYGNNPSKRDVYDAGRQAILHDANARETVRNQMRREKLRARCKEMEEAAKLPPEQSYQRMREIGDSLDLEDRPEFYRIADNLRNPGRHDDKLAVLDVSERLEAGEEFDIRAEYGSRLTPATVRKFESKSYKEALPSIMTTFDAKADEWLGVDENKEFAKKFGAGSRSALKALFLSQTDADEKKDAPRLRRELEEFFKNIALVNPGLLYNSDVETAQGLVPRVLDRHPDIRPKQGTPEYGNVIDALKAANIRPKGAWGSYTDKQLAIGYQSLLGQKKGGAQQ